MFRLKILWINKACVCNSILYFDSIINMGVDLQLHFDGILLLRVELSLTLTVLINSHFQSYSVDSGGF